MTNIETITVEETQVDETEHKVELSITELDMVGGGSLSIIA